jgi:hypothetical protein
LIILILIKKHERKWLEKHCGIVSLLLKTKVQEEGPQLQNNADSSNFLYKDIAHFAFYGHGRYLFFFLCFSPLVFFNKKRSRKGGFKFFNYYIDILFLFWIKITQGLSLETLDSERK